jgi:asparagine synthase (glutamine-hydrolysing)
MCGIAGIVDSNRPRDLVRATLHPMLDALTHRGPDDAGIWDDAAIVLGHRRLSILDLSAHGHQPMVSRSGQYVLLLNGEIYNHQRLRAELIKTGVTFLGRSDTEVLLALIEQVGLEQAITASIGMFAIALWDQRDQCLYLARDRFGEKPIYYSFYSDRFAFGSELKALLADPDFPRTVDRDALRLLLQFGYIPSPYTIFKGTHKLSPGHILSLPAAGPRNKAASAGDARLRRYWSASDVVQRGLVSPFKGTYGEALDHLQFLLADAVSLQMQADVPLGAFLSGGIDSSTVVALMQRQAAHPVRTYSIGFEIDRLDEAKHARAVAQELGTHHTEQYISGIDAIKVVPELPNIYDEPFADPSQIPTVLVARLARKDVTVSLSGDGGDEMFCGYDKYRLGTTLASIPLRRLIGKVLNSLPRRAIELIGRGLPTIGNRPITASRVATLAELLGTSGNRELALATSTIYRCGGNLVPNSAALPTAFSDERRASFDDSYPLLAMTLDTETYLPDDILHKVDRATMAVGLESRAPYLDHRILEFISTLPLEFLLHADASKRVLRDVLYRLVPRKVVDRKKGGFSPPIASWLRNELSGWAKDLLNTDNLRRDGYLDPGACNQLLDAHIATRSNHSKILWALIMFQAWRQHWLH